MKKTFEQPELMVVRMNNCDIVTLSIQGEYNGKSDILAPDRGRDYDSWYEGY